MPPSESTAHARQQPDHSHPSPPRRCLRSWRSGYACGMRHGPADPTDLIEANSEQTHGTTLATSVSTTVTRVADGHDPTAHAAEHPGRDEPT